MILIGWRLIADRVAVIVVERKFVELAGESGRESHGVSTVLVCRVEEDDVLLHRGGISRL